MSMAEKVGETTGGPSRHGKALLRTFRNPDGYTQVDEVPKALPAKDLTSLNVTGWGAQEVTGPPLGRDHGPGRP